MACKPHQGRMLSSLSLLSGGALAFAGISIYNGNENFYANWFMPAVHRLLDPERAHEIAIQLAKHRIVPRQQARVAADDKLLRTSVFGMSFPNPVGLAAGFDKNGEGLRGLSRMGFGFLEVGSVTPKPQEGNPRPRVFRLLRERAIINRYGFNNSGHKAVQENLCQLEGRFGASVAQREGLRAFASDEVIDYFVINISSPNTPGLRKLQQADQLKRLLDAIVMFRNQSDFKKPILLKISPDLSPDEREQVCSVVMTANRKKCAVDGIIVSNTTTWRPESSQEESICEVGGLSGAPLRSLSTQAISHVYAVTKGSLPIIGVGGIFTGEDAFEKIRAGASLVQVYTSFALEGPPVVSAIKRDLARLLRENGYESISEAVGIDHKKH